MEIIAYVSAVYLAVRLMVALVNLLSGQSLPHGSPENSHLVSILIPARNEEKNIGNLLDDLYQIDYNWIEILVYDDESSDQTAAIICDKGLKNNRISYLKGNGPLQGWLGKNYACDQMARRAKGEYLLFLDADVRISPVLIKDSVGFMEKNHLDLLSLFPVQEMRSPGEWFTVPLMNRILAGNLPLILVKKSRMVDFAAANGQFMMFKSDTYRKHWFHEQFRHERVEDIMIARMMKKERYRVHVLLSKGQVTCRMYHNYREGIEGFSKNIHAFFGKKWILLFLYNLMTTLGLLSVWIAFSYKAMLIYLAALVIFSILISVQSRQPVFKNIILMPVQQFSVILVSILAAYRQITGGFFWKGRKI